MSGAPPLLCLGCGHDRPGPDPAERCRHCQHDAQRSEIELARTQHKKKLFRRAPPLRWTFEDEALGASGVVETLDGKVVHAEGHVQERRDVPTGDFARELGGLSSWHAFPYPFEAEGAPTNDEIAVGAFLAGVLGLAARGVIALRYDEWRGFRREGARVVPIQVERLPVAWLKRLGRETQGKLESALLLGLERFDGHQTYRESRGTWATLGEVLDSAHDRLPTLDELSRAELASVEQQHVAEQVSHRLPRLFSALAFATSRLPVVEASMLGAIRRRL